MNGIPFIVATKKIKYLEVNSAKEVKDLHNESYEILMKKIEEDTQKNGKFSHVHGLKK